MQLKCEAGYVECQILTLTSSVFRNGGTQLWTRDCMWLRLKALGSAAGVVKSCDPSSFRYDRAMAPSELPAEHSDELSEVLGNARWKDQP